MKVAWCNHRVRIRRTQEESERRHCGDRSRGQGDALGRWGKGHKLEHRSLRTLEKVRKRTLPWSLQKKKQEGTLGAPEETLPSIRSLGASDSGHRGSRYQSLLLLSRP